jgi:hypothetical protein
MTRDEQLQKVQDELGPSLHDHFLLVLIPCFLCSHPAWKTILTLLSKCMRGLSVF